MKDGKISVKNNLTQGNENNNYKNSTVYGAEVWTPCVMRNMINKMWYHYKMLFNKLKVKNTLVTISEGIKGQQTGFIVNEICHKQRKVGMSTSILRELLSLTQSSH